MPPETIVKERLVRTFRFLKGLNELRNPVARDLSGLEVFRLDQWPAHPCVQVQRGDHEPDVPVIRIQRAKLNPCPNPPQELNGWLISGWQAVDAPVEVLRSRNFQNSDGQTVTVAFETFPKRVAAFEKWRSERDTWMEAERPAVAARLLFERVHGLWTMMQREGDRMELVLADGMLNVPDHSISHPVLMQRVSLEFDPSIPEFRFHTGIEKVELHRALLRLVPTLETRMLALFNEELNQRPVEPLGGDSTTEFLRRLIQGLFASNGEFLNEKLHDTHIKTPSIWRESMLIARPRTAGLSMTLDSIIEDLENPATVIPEGLSRIVGIETTITGLTKHANDGTPPQQTTGTAPDILFSKPANAEQYAIAERLMKTRAVLVQGPPGTGKTHTIANLLGYLLAQGKTVLVTAHTTKALRVLRQQVDEAIQPLALSVLEGDADSQAQLARAAQDIADRLSRSDAASLRQEAESLRQKRRRLLDEAEALRRQLRDARFSEVDELVIGGKTLTPIDAAKWVKAHADQDGWIPGPLQPGILCPLSEQEVRQLYASQTQLTPADEDQLAVPQPGLERLVSPADFHLLAAERAGTDARAQAHRPYLWDNKATGVSGTQLQELHQRVRKSAATLAETQDWLREVLFAGWMGGDWHEAWTDLLATVDTLADEAGAAQKLILAHGPELPPDCPPDDVISVLGEILAFLESGGSFNLWTKLTQRGWHRLIATCRVDGHAPRALDEFRALHAMARLEEKRKQFASRWRRTVESLGGPTVESLGRRPELTAQSYAGEIRKRLSWRQSEWDPLVAELCAAGFRWDAWLAAHPPAPGDHGELTRVCQAASSGLAEVIEAQAALLRQKESSASLQEQRIYLARFPQSKAGSGLLGAQTAWNAEHYAAAYQELARLQGLHQIYQNRLMGLKKLETTAPNWASAIAHRKKPHEGPQAPSDAARAWLWRQLIQELERRAQVSLTDLQARLDRTEQELRQIAARIIEQETWAAQRMRTGLNEQQALVGYVNTMRRVGKAKGKGAPALLKEARRLLAKARHAVPVWIMPLSRVYESFDPRRTKFDVVIVDEASQSDVTALAALYLGREHVIVGDKEQVTPDTIGQTLDEVGKLIDTELYDIPGGHLFDGLTSIYDLAEMAFGGVLALREHFRCVPEIIQFSNHLSYDNAIRPLREPLSAPTHPALISHRVNGYRDERRKLNTVEAEEIASLVITCIQDDQYAKNSSKQPTSFGVITLLGDEQALLIENILRSRLSPDVFVKHRLLCGNPGQFQGDERDVIFLSMVDGPPEEGPLALRDAGPRNRYKKRYNVAVSRARDQLWVVHSLDPENHLKPGDLRRRLIEHARDPKALLREVETQAQKTDSVFERQVLERLVNKGFRVKTQWPVGAYRIDLVVEGKTRRLAVECDGERWHTPENLQRDIERQAILERLGWVFVRIRGSLFFRDPDAAMAPVFAKLAHLDIEPLGTAGIFNNPSIDSSIIERIKRNAELLRAEWSAENPPSP